MKRMFRVVAVTKPGQQNTRTSFDKTRLFTGEPRNAAMKAMTQLCSKNRKHIKGVCTLTVTVQEVRRQMQEGVVRIVPVLDSSNIPKMYKYKLKRFMYHEQDNQVENGPRTIQLDDRDISFKYHVKILESYGRVIPT